MVALGVLRRFGKPDNGFGQIASITAMIQAQVGAFLICRQTLTNIQSQSTDPNILAQAASLLETQTTLENELTTVNSTISNIQAGGSYSASDIANIVAFFGEMEYQMNNVSNLQAAFSGSPMGMSGFELLILAILAGGIVYGLTRG